MKDKRENNFDLVRLLAALQVLVLHATIYLKIENETINYLTNNVLKFFPGVPIFFFISGFLIYSSYERNKNNIVQYAVNRCLRIFPALWICFVLTLLLLCLDFDGNLLAHAPKQLSLWSIGQLSFFQFYTPDVLRFWGVGTPNGSLWTIAIEIQFYILLPILYIFFFRKKYWLPLLFVLSIATNYFIGEYNFQNAPVVGVLSNFFLLPYLYYFLTGILFYKNWKNICIFFKNKFWYWFIFYCLYAYLFNYIFNFDTTDNWITSPVNLIADLLLAGVTFSFSFSFIRLGSKFLKGNDISYGLYIYHMLIINLLVHRGFLGEEIYLIVVILITMLTAIISWKFVEKKILKSKHALTEYIISTHQKYQKDK